MWKPFLRNCKFFANLSLKLEDTRIDHWQCCNLQTEKFRVLHFTVHRSHFTSTIQKVVSSRGNVSEELHILKDLFSQQKLCKVPKLLSGCCEGSCSWSRPSLGRRSRWGSPPCSTWRCSSWPSCRASPPPTRPPSSVSRYLDYLHCDCINCYKNIC